MNLNLVKRKLFGVTLNLRKAGVFITDINNKDLEKNPFYSVIWKST